jgi:uncharacterized protein with GYD domain
MATFVMMGKYSQGAIGEISAARTQEAFGVIETNGGTVNSAYALLGEYDVLLIVDLPGIDEAIATSVALTNALGIGFTTAPAVSVERFDELVAK